MNHDVDGTLLHLVLGDLTDAAVDAVVNAANNSLLGGGGVDGAIHRRGGPAILDACKRLRRERYPEGLPTGGAVLTTGGALPAPHVIHTVGPVWRGGSHGEADLLARAYRSSLETARNAGLRRIAFPSISTGAYGYPVGRAAAVALATVLAYAAEHPGAFDEVRFVLHSEGDLGVYEETLRSLTSA